MFKLFIKLLIFLNSYSYIYSMGLESETEQKNIKIIKQFYKKAVLESHDFDTFINKLEQLSNFDFQNILLYRKNFLLSEIKCFSTEIVPHFFNVFDLDKSKEKFQSFILDDYESEPDYFHNSIYRSYNKKKAIRIKELQLLLQKEQKVIKDFIDTPTACKKFYNSYSCILALMALHYIAAAAVIYSQSNAAFLNILCFLINFYLLYDIAKLIIKHKIHNNIRTSLAEISEDITFKSKSMSL